MGRMAIVGIRPLRAAAYIFTSAAFFSAQAAGEQSVSALTLPQGRLTPVLATVPPRIDGVLDDRCWRDAARRPTATARGFIYRGLSYRRYADEQTTVYVAYDAENLYFGAKCEVTSPDDVVARILIRDANLWYDDSLEIFLDTFHDRKSAYYFAVNPLNTQMDGYFSDEGEVENRNWDTAWYSATKVGASAWTAELCIPLRSLRYSFTSEEWGINFVRFHKKTQDQTVWVDMGENLLRVSRFGTLAAPFARLGRPVVDIQPYVSGSYRDVAKTPEGELGTKAGLDVAARVVPSVAVVGTYKPDFAQVEADPYRINLTDEELFYPEKRPFFLEGQEYFDTPVQVFYSRRIGDVNYGGKLLGRVGPTHLYALALDAYEFADDPDNPGGPYRYDFVVARVKQDITKFASAGFLGVRRQGETWEANDVAAGDATVSFNDEVIFTGQFIRMMDAETGIAENGYDLAVNRYTSTFSGGIGFRDLGRRFDLMKTAYVPYDDVKGYWATADYDWWLYRAGIKKLNFSVEGEHYDNHGDALKTPFGPTRHRLQREGIDGELGLYLENKLTFRLLAEANYRQEIAKARVLWVPPPPYEPLPPQVVPVRLTFDNRYYAATAGYNLEEWSSVYGFYEWGKHYGLDLDYWGGGFSVNPVRRLTLAYDIDYEVLTDIFYEGGARREVDYEFIINRLHADVNITDELAARAFVQSTSDLGHIATNALLGYEFKKGAHIYLVYNEKRIYKDSRRVSVGRHLLDQLVFLKFNYILPF